ncbi:KIR-like CYIR protein [Plasmodium cynomolgi strain B]|uniref:KIR-like CYIR protein n=1 Tax=Plasmodium cynomolgi (strain B) TaxID=1120755 RepID=K6UPY7_PLACD|nr:KIR-like CYIR protein [Plasmodium cynomolgi strain B]GAB64814.1 KIR-like CYIR protein [Plasmodium cynomolgi strain B]
MYEKFNNAVSTSICDSSKIRDSSWLAFKYFTPHKGKIEKAYCYSLTMNRVDEHYGKRCELLYYWIIDIIKGNLDSGHFPQATKSICNLLKELQPTWDCKNIYPGVGESLFEYGKKIYDYTHDHKTLEEQLKKSGGKCSGKYYKYLKDVEEAFKKVNSICGSGKTEPYCEYIKRERTPYADKDEELELEYEEARGQEHVADGREKVENSELALLFFFYIRYNYNSGQLSLIWTII